MNLDANMLKALMQIMGQSTKSATDTAKAAPYQPKSAFEAQNGIGAKIDLQPKKDDPLASALGAGGSDGMMSMLPMLMNMFGKGGKPKSAQDESANVASAQQKSDDGNPAMDKCARNSNPNAAFGNKNSANAQMYPQSDGGYAQSPQHAFRQNAMQPDEYESQGQAEYAVNANQFGQNVMQQAEFDSSHKAAHDSVRQTGYTPAHHGRRQEENNPIDSGGRRENHFSALGAERQSKNERRTKSGGDISAYPGSAERFAPVAFAGYPLISALNVLYANMA